MPITTSIEQVSECALMIRFNDDTGDNLSEIIGGVTRSLSIKLSHDSMGITPSFASILVEYYPHRISFEHLSSIVNDVLSQPITSSACTTSTLELPVYYHLSVGPDLATYHDNGMSTSEVISLHSSTTYSVAAIGFAPGFAFLSGLDEKLVLSRKRTPRVSLPKGSVGIAERHTAVYPDKSPGGWNIIGNCPISLYDPQQDPMIPFSIGANVKFYPVDLEEFLALGGVINQGWS